MHPLHIHSENSTELAALRLSTAVSRTQRAVATGGGTYLRPARWTERTAGRRRSTRGSGASSHYSPSALRGIRGQRRTERGTLWSTATPGEAGSSAARAESPRVPAGPCALRRRREGCRQRRPCAHTAPGGGRAAAPRRRRPRCPRPPLTPTGRDAPGPGPVGPGPAPPRPARAGTRHYSRAAPPRRRPGCPGCSRASLGPESTGPSPAHGAQLAPALCLAEGSRCLLPARPTWYLVRSAAWWALCARFIAVIGY